MRIELVDTPVRIDQTPRNADTADEQAFVPSVHVGGDGTVAVTYYDFRNNTPAAGVPTDYWIVHCHASFAQATSWGNEARLTTTSFDMEQAPAARGPLGFFVGDYEGLANVGNSFIPVFTAVNNSNTANRTDILYTTATP